MEFEENELIQMINDNDEDVKDALYEKYSYIVEVILTKYNRSIYGLKLDYNEIRQEAFLAFTNALVNYNEEKDTSLATFISMVVERRIISCIRNNRTKKSMLAQKSLSLEFENKNEVELLNKIADVKYEPSHMIEKDENCKTLNEKITSSLSPFEKDVYNLMINNFNYIEIAQILQKDSKSIDNCIQRLRKKIKDLVDTNQNMW